MTVRKHMWSNLRNVFSGFFGTFYSVPGQHSRVILKKEKLLSYTSLKKISMFFFKYAGVAARYPRHSKFRYVGRIAVPAVVKHSLGGGAFSFANVQFATPKTLLKLLWFTNRFYCVKISRNSNRLPRGLRFKSTGAKTFRFKVKFRAFLRSTYGLKYDFFNSKLLLIGASSRVKDLVSQTNIVTYLRRWFLRWFDRNRLTFSGRRVVGELPYFTRSIRFFFLLNHISSRSSFIKNKASGFSWYTYLLAHSCSFSKFKFFNVFRLQYLVAHSCVQRSWLRFRMFKFVKNRNCSSYFLLQRFCKKLWEFRRRFIFIRVLSVLAHKFAFKLKHFILTFGLRLDSFLTKTFRVKRMKFSRLLISSGNVKVNGLVARNFKEVLSRFDAVTLTSKARIWIKFVRSRRGANRSHKRRRRGRIRIWYKRSKARAAQWRGSPVIFSSNRRGAVLWDTRSTGLQKYMSKKTMGSLSLKNAQFLYKARILRW